MIDKKYGYVEKQVIIILTFAIFNKTNNPE